MSLTDPDHCRASRRSRFDRSSWACRESGAGSIRACDHSIERELTEALTWGDPDLFAWVQVRVREGTVFLTGEVRDYESFWSLDLLVAVTPGVRYVKNGVLVVPEMAHEPPIWGGEP